MAGYCQGRTGSLRLHNSPGTGVTDSCERQCGCWERNLGPLQVQPVLSTPEPPLQLQVAAGSTVAFSYTGVTEFSCPSLFFPTALPLSPPPACFKRMYFFFYYFTCRNVLPAWISICEPRHVCCLWRPEEGAKSLSYRWQ